MKNIFKLIFSFILLFLFFWNNIFSNLEIPEFNYELQRPSYIIEESKNNYICDKNKEECKVNFKLVDENKKDISSKFECEIITDFNLPYFSNNCNPTTIIIPENTEQKIKFKIYEKDYLDNFKEKEIIINNFFKEKQDEIEKETQIPLSESLEEIPDFKFLLQRPSYIEETTTWEYLCNKEKEECKVNFKLVDENKKDISFKFECEIIADFYIWENKNKCNPNTIIIPDNSQQKITFKISEKNNLENFKQKEILVNNIFEEKQNKIEEETQISLLEIWDEISNFNYELQSPSYVNKIDDNTLECDSGKDECKINFKFLTLANKDISNKYDCEIKADFNLPNFNNKCNPITITIPENSDQTIKIKLFEVNNPDNFIEKEIFIDNTISHYLEQTKITVQWRESKYKKIWYSSMECLTYDKCSVNFTSWKSNSQTYYKWIFWNWEKYYWYNPKSQKFWPWFYRIKLITSNKYWNRKVEIYRLHVRQLLKKTEIKELKNNLKKIVKFRETAFLELDKKIKITKIFKKSQKKITKNLEIKNIKKQLTIKKIFWEPKKIKITKVRNKKTLSAFQTSFSLKEKENKSNERLLKKNIKLNISFQKKNLKISWVTFPESKVEIKIWKQVFNKNSLSDWKYVFKINTLKPWKYKIQASVYDNKWILIARKESREKIITKKYILQLNKYKYKKYLSYIKKKRKKYKSKYKKYKISILWAPKEEIKINKFSLKIFLINTLIAILSLILTSIILIRKKII